MIDCERCWTIEKMQCKTSTKVLEYGECLCLQHWKHLYSWEKITQKIYIPSKIEGMISLWNRCLTYLKSWLSDNKMRFMEWLQLTGKILHGTNYLWLVMKKSSVSRTRSFMYFQILCYVLERWIRTQHQMLSGKTSWRGSRVHHNTELWTTIDGEPTEFEWNISQDSLQCKSSKKCKSSWPKWATHHNSRVELSSCRCLMTSVGDMKTMNGNVWLTLHLWLYLQKKISNRTLVIPRIWIRKEVVFFLHWQTTRRKGQSRWIDDDQVQRKRTPSFPSHESIVPRNAQKQRRWKIKNTLLCRWGYDWKLFFQLSIYGAVSDLCDEYNACQARTERPVLAGQSDPLFEPARLLMTTPTPAQEKLLQKYRKRVERLSQQDRLIKNCTDMQDSWKQLESDSTSWQKTLTSSYNLQSQ